MRPAISSLVQLGPRLLQKFHIGIANLQIVLPGDSGQLVGTRQRNDGQNQNQRELRSSPGLFFPFSIPSFDGLGLLAFTVIPRQPLFLAFLLYFRLFCKLGKFFSMFLLSLHEEDTATRTLAIQSPFSFFSF